MIKRTFSIVAVLLSESSMAVQSRSMEPSLKGHYLQCSRPVSIWTPQLDYCYITSIGVTGAVVTEVSPWGIIRLG